MKKRGKDEEGAHLWRQVTQGVRAYGGDRKTLPKKPASSRPTQPRTTPFAPPPPPVKGKGFDRATETRLKRGELPIEGRLDLHGLTQDKALTRLEKFIRQAAAAEKRTLLVITGKGAKSEGILKKMLPLWLERPDLRGYILAVTPAHIKDGGSGAFYVRLRKNRP